MNTLMKLNEPKKQQGRMRRFLPNIILAIALGIIAILAVPTILMIGVIFDNSDTYRILLNRSISGPMKKEVNIVPMPTKEEIPFAGLPLNR